MRGASIITSQGNEVTQPGSYLNSLVSADIVVTRRCPQDCDFCWELDLRESNGRQQLRQVPETPPAVWDADPAKVDSFILSLSPLIRKIVFTGGEPDAYRHLAGRLRVAREAGIIAVVSTSGLSPKQFEATMPYASRYEVAVDGPREVHEQSRRGFRSFGKSGVFDKAIDTILRAQRIGKPVGIRTLVNTDTVETVAHIPRVLSEQGVKLGSRVRMKLYQQSPVGPRSSLMAADPKDISTSKLLQAALRVKLEQRKLRVHASPWRQATHRGAYIQPNGQTYTILINPETGLPQEVSLGNAYDSSEPSKLPVDFAGACAGRIGYLLMDRGTKKPFNLNQWSGQVFNGQHEDWLAMDNPTPIAYEQAVDSYTIGQFNSYPATFTLPHDEVASEMLV